jgi:hypothetical protein
LHYADAVINATTNPPIHLPGRLRLMAAAVVVGLLAGAAGLWWRFGEGVFAQSIMNAIMACF